MYFAFRCIDSQPEKIRTTISRRDNAWSDDWAGFSLDSSRAGQLAYHFFVNPSGIQMDGLQSGTNGEDMSPDWVWQSAGHVSADGWAKIESLEDALPQRFGRQHGHSVLAQAQPLGRLFVVAADGSGQWVFESNATIVFDELHSRRLFEVIPSATLSSNQSRVNSSSWNQFRSKGDLGLSSFATSDDLASVATADWNAAHLIVRDNVATHMLNGRLMSVTIDDDAPNRKRDGLIGMQVHTGPPMKIEYRNIRLKRW